MNIDEMHAEILRRKSEIERMQTELHALLDQWCVAACPHKVGDKVTFPGFTHRGKKCVVDRIKGNTDHGYPMWRAYGKLLKADGSVGLIEVDWCGTETRKETP